MRDDKKLVVGDPPKEYDYKKFSDILNRIEVFANSIMAAGPARLSAIDTTGMPTSGTGLRDNAVYNHNGVLVVQPATGVDADTLGGHDPSYYGAALGYTPVNKAGDTMTGGLAFGSAVASGATDVTRHIALYGTAYGFSITGGTLNYVSGGANHDFYTTTNTFVGRISSSGLLLGNTTGGSPGAGKVNAVDYQINGTSISSLYVAATDYTAADVLTKIKTVDGSGSGLDADTLDGHDTAYFQTALGYTPANVAGDTFTGQLKMTNGVEIVTGLGNVFRMKSQGIAGTTGYGVFWRVDQNTTYLMRTALDDPNGSWDPPFIFTIPHATKLVSVAGDPTAALGIATKQYVDAGDIGVSQTWQDVSASRAVQTAYQNTTGKTIAVSIDGAKSGTTNVTASVSTNNVTYVVVCKSTTQNSEQHFEFTFLVPPSHYYKVDTATVNIACWSELR